MAKITISKDDAVTIIDKGKLEALIEKYKTANPVKAAAKKDEFTKKLAIKK